MIRKGWVEKGTGRWMEEGGNDRVGWGVDDGRPGGTRGRITGRGGYGRGGGGRGGSGNMMAEREMNPSEKSTTKKNILTIIIRPLSPQLKGRIHNCSLIVEYLSPATRKAKLPDVTAGALGQFSIPKCNAGGQRVLFFRRGVR